MFRPNLRAVLHRKASRRDIFGTETFESPKPVHLACVNLSALTQVTTVRADSSASRGAAEDLINQARIMVPPKIALSVGDVIEVWGFLIEVSGIHPRFDTRGIHHHNDIRGKVRSEL